MDWVTTLILMFGGVVFFLLLGLPIVFSFLVVNLIGAFFVLGGDVGIMQMVRNMQGSVAQYALAPIVLFVFMGEIMLHTKIAARAIDAVDRLFTRVPGRLSLIAVTGGTVFATLSGSTLANTAVLGKTLLPEMQSRGYHSGISMGPIMAVGGIAMLIPPSGLAVLLGSLGKISINQLLIAAIVPAAMMAALFFIYIIVRCVINPSLAPVYEVEKRSWSERLMPFVKYVMPLGGIFIAVVGSMVAGIATPTESAALGSLASIIAAAIYRSLSLKALIDSVTETMKFSAMILFVICASSTFSQILAFSGATQAVSAFVAGLGLSPIELLIAMLLILVVLGCFMEQVSMMMLTLPIFMPIALAAGIEPVWFGVMLLIVLEMSLCTPPLGLLIFVMQGIAPKGTSLSSIYASVTPFILLEVFVLALIMMFPIITHWLPSVLL